MVKDSFREEAKNRLALFTEAEMRTLSGKLCRRIIQSELFSRSEALLSYYPISREPDIIPVLKEALASGKKLYLPRIEGDRMEFYPVRGLSGDHLRKNKWGIYEPIDPDPSPLPSPDGPAPLMLVPGLAFTPEGRRLGRGGGYYDRYLAGKENIYKAGTAYPFQILPDLPVESHDIIMDKVFY